VTSSLDSRFPRYTDFDPLVPVWCITPNAGATMHRFFDTSPISPSGRYVALTRFPFEDRLPAPGDVAQIVLVDLDTGEERIVADTRGWDTQLGAQAQWGADDSQLFYNDMDTEAWRPFGVKLDPLTGDGLDLDGTVYMASRDGRWAASPCLLRTGLTQAGYGVVAPPGRVPHNHGAATDDGLYITDTETGRRRLLVSFAEILELATPQLQPAEPTAGAFYGFHVKWTPQGDRLMLVLRWRPDDGGKMGANVVTMAADGSDIHIAMPADVWGRGGHHPDWHPDGQHVTMNLKLDGTTLRLVQARYDGSDLRVLTDAVLGSGHPSFHPDGRHMVTDSYAREPVAFGDGTTPIRLIDVEAGTEQTLVRIRTAPDWEGPKHELRVDPHPAWDRAYRRIAFNACPDGTRRVYIADLSTILDLPADTRTPE